MLRRVFANGVAVLAEDTRHEQGHQTNLTLNTLGVQSLVCVPFQNHAGRVFGAVQLDRFQAGRAASSN